MKDEFDDVTPDMFEKSTTRRAAKPDMKGEPPQPRSKFLTEGEVAAKQTRGGGGAMPKSNRDITKNYKKGGKVAGKLATRGYGCVKK